MAEVPANSVTEDAGLPQVRLELRYGAARPTLFHAADLGFLVGTVPGCDLRLPGANQPPVLCLIARTPEGVVLRKLAPAQPVLVNGQPASVTTLADGDRVTLGAAELLVHIQAVAAARPVVQVPAELEERSRHLDARQRQLDEQTRQLETDRVIWYRRRQEVEQECRQQNHGNGEVSARLQERERELNLARADVEKREQALEAERQRLDQQQREFAARAEPLARQRQEVETVRRELDEGRRRLYDRYRERRDRLAGLQEAVNQAARKIQERKRAIDAEAVQAAARTAELDSRQAELDSRAEELNLTRQALEEEHRRWEAEQKEREANVAALRADLAAREADLPEARRVLEEGQRQHQAALVRLDRREAELEKEQQNHQARVEELERKRQELQRDTQDLEEQARQLDAWHAKLTADADRLLQQNGALEPTRKELAQRAAALEGQQAMLTTLRSRLERMREEARREAQALTEQRARQEAAETDLQTRLQEAEVIRTALEADRRLHDEERRRFQERSTLMETAVARMRQVQESLDAQEAQVREQSADLEARLAEHTEQMAVVQARSAQLSELQQRLEADRQALREREQELTQAELIRAALQEQLQRRSEELAARQRVLQDKAREHEEATAGFQDRFAEIEARRAELEREQQAADEKAALRLKELEARQAELEAWGQRLEASRQKLQEMGRTIAGQRKELGVERLRGETDRYTTRAALEQAETELAARRGEILALHQQMPDLETRAAETVGRLAEARERLSEHLAELHTYAGQAREDLEAMRGQVQAEAEQVRQQGLTLHRARDEHRLSVAAFRQQLIDWQAQVAEMKRSLAEGETRIERRQAEVDEQARQVDATSARLAQQVEQLAEEQRQVAERRSEMERHLADMREWYRRKLRELAVGRETVREIEPAPETAAPTRDILVLTGDAEPGDRQLGDLLRSLELVDADTLNALLVEARRQRRTLRQVLLAGNYLTLYQLALMEAGNLDALVLGPTRVVDRLRANSREVVYRVFDPRRGKECVLRHLTEAEAQDAVHPDEFRQRFAAAALVQHPHLAATLEVLEIAGRPAVLQEWITGLASGDWPALAAVPGVCYRLLAQAALGLQTIHQAGLVHGRLRAASFVLTGDGVLKLGGLGEPPWLVEPVGPEDVPAVDAGNDDAAADLAALGAIAADWGSVRRKGRPPKGLQTILDRLAPEAGAERFASAGALLEALDQAGAEVPPNAEAWERLLRHVRDHITGGGLRQSA